MPRFASGVLLLAPCLGLCVFTCGSARAAAPGSPEFALGLGASLLNTEGNELGDDVGPWAEVRFSIAPLPKLQPLRLGFGLEFSYQSEKVESAISSETADLFLITPEVQLSWRQSLGERFYVEPGVGVGALIGVVDLFGAQEDTEFSARPFVRFGYQTWNWSGGIEVGYQFSSLDFGGGSSDVQNLNIGAFIAFRF